MADSGARERDPELVAGLRDFLRGRAPGEVLTFERLRRLTANPDPLTAADALAVLVSRSELEQFVRVEFPPGKVIAEYSSILEVPDVLRDAETDAVHVVTPEDLLLLYRVPSRHPPRGLWEALTRWCGWARFIGPRLAPNRGDEGANHRLR